MEATRVPVGALFVVPVLKRKSPGAEAQMVTTHAKLTDRHNFQACHVLTVRGQLSTILRELGQERVK
jgi:hypothetical protein